MSQNDKLDLEKNIGLVRSNVTRLHPWIEDAGVPMSKDELFSELCELWFTCTKHFKEGKGFQFSTYYARACWNQVRRIVEVHMRTAQVNAAALSLDQPTGDSEDGALFEIVASNDGSPEDAFTYEALIDDLMNHLSARSQELLRLALEMPDDVIAMMMPNDKYRLPTYSPILGARRAAGIDRNTFAKLRREIEGALKKIGVEAAA